MEGGTHRAGSRGMGRALGRADAAGNLRESAGPRLLTVAIRYCTVPQSLTARLKRSSRYCQEEPRASGYLDRCYPEVGGLWVPSPALLASALPPEANFSLHTLSRGGPQQAHIF